MAANKYVNEAFQYFKENGKNSSLRRHGGEERENVKPNMGSQRRAIPRAQWSQ